MEIETLNNQRRVNQDEFNYRRLLRSQRILNIRRSRGKKLLILELIFIALTIAAAGHLFGKHSKKETVPAYNEQMQCESRSIG